MDNFEMGMLNPEIKEVIIGKKNLRKLTLYPLSVVDQFKVTDLFTEALGALLANKNSKDVVLIGLFTAAIKANLPQILALVVDPEESVIDLLGNITNNQLTEIANILYTVNYEVISKNVVGLLKKLPDNLKPESLSGRPSQPSVESMDTSSMTFSGNLGETEE